MNRLSNGGFDGDLANWTASNGASFIASEGYKELGAVHLAAGQAISQSFYTPASCPWMIELWVKGGGSGNVTLTINDDNNNTVYTASIAVTPAWTQGHAVRVGLPMGHYTVTVSYADVACYVDDVSVARVDKTRAELALEVARLLGDLASADAGYSVAGDGERTEGDYTEAVDAGLRAVGAVDRAGRPDVRFLSDDIVDPCIDEIQRYMLHKLHRYYSRNATDFELEGRSEKPSQRRNAIENILGISVGGRRAASGRGVQQRRLIHGQ
ncbi:MAG: hypothetical protein KJ063_02410 [Anaerolineae bacterium]|nr:hypothetical protein [Anaerolineae bacterium]